MSHTEPGPPAAAAHQVAASDPVCRVAAALSVLEAAGTQAAGSTLALAAGYAAGAGVTGALDALTDWYDRQPSGDCDVLAAALRSYRATGDPHRSGLAAARPGGGTGSVRPATGPTLLWCVPVALARGRRATRIADTLRLAGLGGTDRRHLQAACALTELAAAAVEDMPAAEALDRAAGTRLDPDLAAVLTPSGGGNPVVDAAARLAIASPVTSYTVGVLLLRVLAVLRGSPSRPAASRTAVDLAAELLARRGAARPVMGDVAGGVA